MGRMVVVVVVVVVVFVGVCWGQAPPSPSPSPTLTPSLLPSCVVDLIPIGSQTTGGVGGVGVGLGSFVVRPFSTLGIVAVSVCNIDPRGSAFEWSYTSQSREGDILSQGSLCFFPLASCSGSKVQIDTSFFPSNVLVTINVSASLVYFGNILEEQSSLEFFVLPQSISLFLSGGFVNFGYEDVSMNALLVNNNDVKSVVFSWSCFPDRRNPSNCPPCPNSTQSDGSTLYSVNTTNLLVSFPEQALPAGDSTCEYSFECTAIVSTKNLSFTTQDARSITSKKNAYYPSLEFTQSSLATCQNLVAGTNLYIQLEAVVVPVGFEVKDYLWFDSFNCSSEEFNCGGDGFPFLFIPSSSLPICQSLQTAVSVVVGGPGVLETTVTTLKTCEYFVIGPPAGGRCFPEFVDFCVLPGTSFRITCLNWKPSCPGGSEIFLYSLVSVSEDNYIRFTSSSPTFSYSVGDDQTVFVLICDSFGGCAASETFNISVCEVPDPIASDTAGDLLDEAQRCLINSDLTCGLDQQLAAADALPVCQGGNERETLRLIAQTNALFERFFLLTGRNATSLPDLTTILQIWVITAFKSCQPVPSLLFQLAQVCESTTYSGSIASASLDGLIGPLLNSVSNDPTQFYDYLDFAFDVNDCYQKETGPPDCGEQLPLFYRGETFSYFQQVISLESMTFGFVIETEAANFYFPPNFDQQLIQLYKDQIDSNPDLLCVIFNLVTAQAAPDDARLYTPLSGLTVRFVQTIAGTYSVSRVIELNPVENVMMEFFIPPRDDCDDDEFARFSLTPEASSVKYVPSYYLGQGIFDGDGVTTINVTCTSLFANVTHFSNLGLLFYSTHEGWTPLRILSVVLFGVIWTMMIILFLLVSCSKEFRKRFRFETETELAQRVLGTQRHLAKRRRLEPVV